MTDQVIQKQRFSADAEPLLKVWPVIPADGTQLPIITIQWSTSPALPALLASRQGLKPYLLVVVEKDGRESSRQVFRHQMGERSVVVKWSGDNTFHCTVVWLENHRSPRWVVLRKESGAIPGLLERNPDLVRLEEIDAEADLCWEKMTSGIQVNGRTPRKDTRSGGPELMDQRREVEKPPYCWKLRTGYRLSSIEEEVIFGVTVPQIAFGDPSDQTVWTRFLARIYPVAKSSSYPAKFGAGDDHAVYLLFALVAAVVAAVVVAIIAFAALAAANLVVEESAWVRPGATRGRELAACLGLPGGPPTVVEYCSGSRAGFRQAGTRGRERYLGHDRSRPCGCRSRVRCSS